MPKVSIVLPFYNAEKTLQKMVSSILNQSFKNFELILVNNNSKDKSIDIAKKFKNADNRIALLNEKKQGVVFASNKGFENAKSNYIARADADDIWHPKKIEFQYNFLEKNKKTDVLATRVNFCGDTANKGLKYYTEYTNKFLLHSEISINRFTELLVINPSLMFRKKLFDENSMYKHGNFPEDYELFLRLLESGANFAKLPEYLLDWHDSPDRLTRIDSRYSSEAFYKTKTPFIANYLKQHNPFYPNIIIWGAGKTSQKRAKLLEKFEINIEYYIEVDKKKINGKNIIHYDNIPEPGKIFILSYVSNRGAYDLIKNHLKDLRYSEGKNFLMIS